MPKASLILKIQKFRLFRIHYCQPDKSRKNYTHDRLLYHSMFKNSKKSIKPKHPRRVRIPACPPYTLPLSKVIDHQIFLVMPDYRQSRQQTATASTRLGPTATHLASEKDKHANSSFYKKLSLSLQAVFLVESLPLPLRRRLPFTTQ